MMSQCGIEACFRIPRPGLALQFSNVFSIDRPVVHSRALDFCNFAAAHGTYLWGRNGQIRGGIARRACRSQESPYFEVDNDGIWKAELPRGCHVLDLVSLLDGAQRGDPAAIFEHDGVRGSP